MVNECIGPLYGSVCVRSQSVTCIASSSAPAAPAGNESGCAKKDANIRLCPLYRKASALLVASADTVFTS
jgi:hypothetical protein